MALLATEIVTRLQRVIVPCRSTARTLPSVEIVATSHWFQQPVGALWLSSLKRLKYALLK